jgi:hypothetical protein
MVFRRAGIIQGEKPISPLQRVNPEEFALIFICFLAILLMLLLFIDVLIVQEKRVGNSKSLAHDRIQISGPE